MDTYNPSDDKNLKPEEGVVAKQNPLSLDIDDDVLCETVDDLIEKSRKFFEKEYNLYDRRKKNVKYLFGRQIKEKVDNKELKIYESRYLDNALYEIESSIKPLALAKLPEMIVLGGSDSDEDQKTAKDATTVVNDDIQNREIRVALSIAFKHRPAYFVGVIKAWWDPAIGEYGDSVFKSRHPDMIDVDHTCPEPNADKMKWIAETLPITIKECVMRWPDKKEKLFVQLRSDNVLVGTGEPNEKMMATEIKIKEVHFTWYIKKGEGKEENYKEEETDEIPDEQHKDEWERCEGVLWKYKKVMFQKMKEPNFDYEGDERYFTYEDPADESSKKELTEEQIIQSVMSGAPIPGQKEQIYHNYFKNPRKPYFFMTYDQWGKIPYDETSRLEQNVNNQEIMDIEGKQIHETLKSRTKHVFSEDAGLKAEDVQKMDMNNPNEDLLIKGKVNETYTNIPPERPDGAQYNALDSVRSRMYSIASATAIRGELQSDVASSNQIAREANYSVRDDETEETINAACEWISQWRLQFIKLRYTNNHFRYILGDKGSYLYLKLNRDTVSDGMVIKIKSSGTDKLRNERNAKDLAGMKMIDPYHMFKDMDMSDPLGRTKYLMMFMSDPSSYMAAISGLGETTEELASNLNGMTPGADATAPPGAPPAPPQPPMTPQQPSPENMGAGPPTAPQASPRIL